MKRGPKPSGKPRARGINFSVSAEHEEWLKALPDRSAWLAKKIEEEREKSTQRGDERGEIKK